MDEYLDTAGGDISLLSTVEDSFLFMDLVTRSKIYSVETFTVPRSPPFIPSIFFNFFFSVKRETEAY